MIILRYENANKPYRNRWGTFKTETMNNNREINVVYKSYIPDEWVEEFENNIKTAGIQFKKVKDEDKYYSFTGPEFADIIIFIRDNPESIFLAPALYDIIKSGIIGLWKKLKSLNVQKMQSGETETKQKKISIRYEDAQERGITIIIEGDLDDDLIEDIVEESLEVLKTDKKEVIFQQPDFVDNSQGKKAIELKYNPNTKVWEPENFGEIRRKMDEYQRWAEDNFSN